jgi:23S rRNA (cytosine1962-C5)-methyltransferase
VEREADGTPQPGESVEVRAHDGRFLAVAARGGGGGIYARVWSFEPTQLEPAFFTARIRAAAEARKALRSPGELPSACRLVFGEADGLPGLTVDKYGEYLVCQLHFAGVEAHRRVILDALRATLPCRGILDRSDDAVRAREGLPPVATVVIEGEAPADEVEIAEGPLRFLVDLRGGQKTGFYLDQASNRAIAAEYCRGASVLNAFSYTGAFGVWALHGGAEHVLNMDSSAPALELARRNADLNGFRSTKALECMEADVFQALRALRDRGRQFDVIILDPPKFAETAGQVGKASRAYKDINLLGFKLLKPGGRLVTFSCSGAMEPNLFQKIVADAALDASRPAWIERRLGQAPDHPVPLSFPEGAYLKGLVCRAGDRGQGTGDGKGIRKPDAGARG